MKNKAASLIAPVIIALLLTIGLLMHRKTARSPEVPIPSEVHESLKPQAEGLPPNTAHDPQAETQKTFTPQEFESFTQKFKSELPSMNELRAMDPHAMHPGLITAYGRSGKIARAAIDQPELRDLAYATLEYCANLDRYDQSVRAMCLRQHRKIRAAEGNTSFDERNRIHDLKSLDSLIKRSLGAD